MSCLEKDDYHSQRTRAFKSCGFVQGCLESQSCEIPCKGNGALTQGKLPGGARGAIGLESWGSLRDTVLGVMFPSSGLPFNLPGGLKGSQETGSLGSHGSKVSGSAMVAGSGSMSATDGEPESPASQQPPRGAALVGGHAGNWELWELEGTLPKG